MVNIILFVVVALVFWFIGIIVFIAKFPKLAEREAIKTIVKKAGGWGKIVHKREIADCTYSAIVKPNVDTIYSTGVLDLRTGPFVLEIPPINDYWSFQFMADNTDVFAVVGQRTHGLNKFVRLLIADDCYQDDTKGMEKLRTHSNIVWFIGRFLIRGKHDLPLIHKIQDQIKLIPLADYPG